MTKADVRRIWGDNPPDWVTPTNQHGGPITGQTLTPGQKWFGIASLVFLTFLFPPFLLVILIWGIVELVRRK